MQETSEAVEKCRWLKLEVNAEDGENEAKRNLTNFNVYRKGRNMVRPPFFSLKRKDHKFQLRQNDIIPKYRVDLHSNILLYGIITHLY